MDTTSRTRPPLRPGAPRHRRLRVITALVIREMATSFGRSAGGYLWAILEPLGGILLLAIAFSLALRQPPLGTSFILFYASGIIPFNMYRGMSGGVTRAVSSNKGLLSYPVVTALDAVFAKFVLTFLTALLTAVVLSVGIILVFDLHVVLDPSALVGAFCLAALFGLGVGTVNCVLFGLFPTWKHIWTVITRPLFLFSGILFLFESAPPAFQSILWWNPIVHIVALMRSGFYGSYNPIFISYPYVIGVSLSLFVIGAYLLRRHTSLLLDQ